MITPIPRRCLGQNYLINTGVVRKIVEAAELTSATTVLEIGPGPGALTHSMAIMGAHIVAIDADRRMVELLKRRFVGQANVEIVHANFLKYSWAELAGKSSIVVVGNIPYNLTAPIIFNLLDNCEICDRAILTMQREVARRLSAKPGGKAYGAMSVSVQANAIVEQLFDIKPGSFHPAPLVTSTTVRLSFPKPPPHHVNDRIKFREVVRTAFSKRRKMLRNSFAVEDLIRAGIDPQKRAENLSVTEFITLTDQISKDRL